MRKKRLGAAMADPTGPSVVVAEVDEPSEIALCLQIRRDVFIVEQGVSEMDEVDGFDPKCRHYLARVNGHPMGAARVKPQGDALKVQRVAVRRAGRGTGLGLAIMRQIISDAATQRPDADLVLGAQLSAIGFYEKLGFEPEGDEYLDAGIAHRDMRLRAPGA